MKKHIITLLTFACCLWQPAVATTCTLLDNPGSDWVAQHDACPSSPTAAYNAIIQWYVAGKTTRAQQLLQQSLKDFNSFQPLKQLAREMPRWSADPYRLIAQLTDSALKQWVAQLPPPAPFVGTPPQRGAMPALPELVKDEFETTAQFRQRVAKAQRQRKQLSEQLEQDYQQAVRDYNRAVAAYNRRLEQDKAERPQKILRKQRELLAENIQLVLGKPMLQDLNYDADHGVFYGQLVSSHGNFAQPLKFAVPLNKARGLKQQRADITPQVDFSTDNNRLSVTDIRIPYAGKTYAAQLTAEVNTAEVLTAQLDDAQLQTAYTALSTIAPTEVVAVDDSAFFSTALTLEADPELARLKQQQAELARQQQAVRQQQALAAERQRLAQQIARQQQALAGLGGRLGAQYKGLKPTIEWAFKPSSRNTDTVMVIIGNRNYQQGVPLVHYAYNDARAMRQFAHQGLGLSAEDILYEEDATKGVMEGLFKSTLPARIKAGKKNVLVYFSGHGMAANNDASLLPVDSRPNTAAVTGYSRNTLMQQLASLNVNTTVILDACYTGTSKDGAPLLAGKPVFKAPKRAWVPPNVTLISAASGNQIAWMDEQKGHSLMTYHLLKGLQGDADNNDDGSVDSNELAAYLKTSVNRAALRLHEQPQQPEVSGKQQVLVQY